MKKVLVLVILLAIFSSSDTLADPQTSNYNSAHFEFIAQTGFGGINTPAIDADQEYSPNTFVHVRDTKLQKGMSWRVAGAWIFDADPKFLWGPEFGYSQVPQNFYSTNAPKATPATAQIIWSSVYFDFLLATRYEIAPDLDFICKLGIADILQNIKISDDVNRDIKNSDATFAPEFVMGIGYNLTSHLFVNFTYNIAVADHIDTNFNSVTNLDKNGDDAGKVATISTYLFGINYLL
jgi:hypothetical protein